MSSISCRSIEQVKIPPKLPPNFMIGGYSNMIEKVWTMRPYISSYLQLYTSLLNKLFDKAALSKSETY